MPAAPNPEEEAETEPHLHRREAESFGADAERYDRTRPAYPDALMQRIAAASPGRHVLDVGCGTGIAARQFQAAGCIVLGVEPDARMAEFAAGTGVKVEVATFEAWDPAGRMFDTVIAGASWHWIDPVAGAAKAARVLRPGGLLAPIYNVFEAPAEVTEALASAYREVAPEAPVDLQPTSRLLDTFQVLFAKIADGIRQAGGFSETEQWQVSWDRTYTRDEWLDQLATQPLLSQLSPAQRAEVLAAVGDSIDTIGGSFRMPYTSAALTAVRTGAL
jgi:SAM-dependent methyltransferase